MDKSFYILQILAECLQCYCREIRQMLTFIISLYCLKAYHRPDHLYVLLNITEKIIPKPNIFTETRTQDSFLVCDVSSCNLLAEKKFLFFASFYCA
jgi:hypothetical protein